MKKLFNELMKKLASLLTDLRLRDLCPLMTGVWCWCFYDNDEFVCERDYALRSGCMLKNTVFSGNEPEAINQDNNVV